LLKPSKDGVFSHQVAANDSFAGSPMHHSHSGQPADVLHGAGGNESAWSGWSNKSNLWAELGGKPAGTAPETAMSYRPQPVRRVEIPKEGHHTPPGD